MKNLVAAFVGLLVLPSVVLAHDIEVRAGTDDYLRDEIGLTDVELATPFATENRLPFDLATGETTIIDPLGDVLSRVGTTSPLTEPWGDISEASLKKNETTKTWDLTVTLGGDVPVKPSTKAQLFFYTDRDGDTANNMAGGIRDRMDAEFALQHNAEKGWYTDFRWYNPPPVDFWAIDKETAATFTIKGSVVTLHVPYSEISSDVVLNWRVVMAIADGSQTEIDAAPTVGFPKAITTTDPNGSEEPTSAFWGTAFGLWIMSPFAIGGIVATALVIAAIVYAIRVARRRKAGPRA